MGGFASPQLGLNELWRGGSRIRSCCPRGGTGRRWWCPRRPGGRPVRAGPRGSSCGPAGRYPVAGRVPGTARAGGWCVPFDPAGGAPPAAARGGGAARTPTAAHLAGPVRRARRPPRPGPGVAVAAAGSGRRRPRPGSTRTAPTSAGPARGPCPSRPGGPSRWLARPDPPCIPPAPDARSRRPRSPTGTDPDPRSQAPPRPAGSGPTRPAGWRGDAAATAPVGHHPAGLGAGRPACHLARPVARRATPPGPRAGRPPGGFADRYGAGRSADARTGAGQPPGPQPPSRAAAGPPHALDHPSACPAQQTRACARPHPRTDGSRSTGHARPPTPPRPPPRRAPGRPRRRHPPRAHARAAGPQSWRPRPGRSAPAPHPARPHPPPRHAGSAHRSRTSPPPRTNTDPTPTHAAKHHVATPPPASPPPRKTHPGPHQARRGEIGPAPAQELFWAARSHLSCTAGFERPCSNRATKTTKIQTDRLPLQREPSSCRGGIPHRSLCARHGQLLLLLYRPPHRDATIIDFDIGDDLFDHYVLPSTRCRGDCADRISGLRRHVAIKRHSLHPSPLRVWRSHKEIIRAVLTYPYDLPACRVMFL